MDRRQFLQTTAAAGFALRSGRASTANFDDQKVRRVGMIGSGWYGKSDIFRLVQVSPVEIV